VLQDLPVVNSVLQKNQNLEMGISLAACRVRA